MTDKYTPAQIYSLAFGATLLLVGLLGFIAESSFDAGSNVDGSDLILFEVNGWHNFVHIASGLVGLALWRSVAGARNFALGFGIVYAIVTLWGFIDGDDVLGLIPVNGADNLLHLAIAALGIAAGLASRDDPARGVKRRPGRGKLSSQRGGCRGRVPLTRSAPLRTQASVARVQSLGG